MPAGSESEPWEELADSLWIHAASLALLENPASLLHHPLLSPLVRRITALDAAAGPLPPLVAAADGGPLLLADGPDGWLMGTLAGTPEPAALEPQLAAQGQIPAPLELERGTVQVWTRLQPAVTGRERGAAAAGGDLQASLAGWQLSRDNQSWWGKSLRLLQEEGSRRNGGADRIGQLRALDLPTAPVQWALDPLQARTLLKDWNPWRLLSVLSGGGLAEAVQGAAIGVDLEPGEAVLRFDGMLNLG
jgi:hypothetical protein